MAIYSNITKQEEKRQMLVLDAYFHLNDFDNFGQKFFDRVKHYGIEKINLTTTENLRDVQLTVTIRKGDNVKESNFIMTAVEVFGESNLKDSLTKELRTIIKQELGNDYVNLVNRYVNLKEKNPFMNKYNKKRNYLLENWGPKVTRAL